MKKIIILSIFSFILTVGVFAQKIPDYAWGTDLATVQKDFPDMQVSGNPDGDFTTSGVSKYEIDFGNNSLLTEIDLVFWNDKLVKTVSYYGSGNVGVDESIITDLMIKKYGRDYSSNSSSFQSGLATVQERTKTWVIKNIESIISLNSFDEPNGTTDFTLIKISVPAYIKLVQQQKDQVKGL